MSDLQKWNDEDFRQMKHIERAIIDVVIPLVQNVNPLLAFYAMIRCARVMLRKGEPDAQKLVLPTVVAYLEGKTHGPSDSPLWLPPSSRVN